MTNFINRSPEGYKKLLIYKKGAEIQKLTIGIADLIPRGNRKLRELADQMPPSARSLVKNIVEGWKRRTTDEYITFIGFSEGSNAELLEDARDICLGVYSELMGIRGIMGVRGPSNGNDQKGLMGARGERGTDEPINPLTPFKPIFPVSPIKPFTPLELDHLKFYPLDPSLPPAVQLYLRCKEMDYLLYKLKQSLDQKMDQDKTRTGKDMARRRLRDEEEARKEFDKELEDILGPDWLERRKKRRE